MVQRQNQKILTVLVRNVGKMFLHILKNSNIEDVVISGGDAYMLTPAQIKYIGKVFFRFLISEEFVTPQKESLFFQSRLSLMMLGLRR